MALVARDPELLSAACRNRPIENINSILEIDASQCNDGMYYACLYKRADVAKLMIDYGADLNMGLRYACIDGCVEIVKLIIEHGAANLEEGLMHACIYGHIELVKFLLERGATYINQGMSEACYSGHIDIVKLFISHGAISLNEGLIRASFRRHVEISILLIENGANMDYCSLRLTDDHMTHLMEHGIIKFGKRTLWANCLRSTLNKQIINATIDLHIFPEFFHIVNEYRIGISP